jgi:hypothetical protein
VTATATYTASPKSLRMSDGPLTPWALLIFLLALVGLAALVLWRVLEATLLRLHGG